MLEIGMGGGSFPKQKISTGRKNIDFVKKCVESAVDSSNFSSGVDVTRMTRQDMITNYDLVDGILNKEDVFKISNPWGLEGFDRSIVSYQLIKPRINLLLGEEYARSFNWLVKVTNYAAINEKEEALFKRIFKEAAEIALQKEFDEEAAKQRLQDLTDELTLSIQDRREAMATDLLTYEQSRLNLSEKWNKGFSDAIVAAEEVYHISTCNDKPDVRTVNPLSLTVIGHNADSIYIEDSDIIIEDSYYPIGWAIDKYYDYLTPADIDRIENGTNSIAPEKAKYLKYENALPSTVLGVEENISSNDFQLKSQHPFDTNGNVRVCIVTWKSRRKIGQLTTVDPEGNEVKSWVTEDYKPNEDAGEKVKWLWPTEWWSAVRIADDIYPSNWGPRRPITESQEVPFISTSGYVGTIYKINSNKAYSMVSSLKSYQYLYDELMDRLKEALAKFQGPMMELDIAKMPADWKPEQWLYYARKLGYLIIDSFKEIDKGVNKGQMAGHFNTTGKILNPDLGNYIQQIILMLNYIEDRVGEVTGINRQRLGAVENREMVGTVERAVTQSNHITERLFELHNNTKSRVLTELLNVAKYLYKDKQDKLQYITDDMNSQILHLDGFQLNTADYGIFVMNAASDPMLLATLRQMVQAGIQNGSITMGQAVDLLSSKNMGTIRRSLKEADKKMQRIQEQQQQAQLQAQQQAVAMQQEVAQQQMQKDVAIKTMEIEGKLSLEEMKQKLESENVRLAERALEEDIRANKAEEALKEKDIEARKQIAKEKPKTNNNK